MKKSKRLAPIVQLQSMKERLAAKEYVAAKDQLDADTKKLEELLTYAREYQQMVESEGQGGISAKRLLSCHQFVNRLMAAIGEQRDQVEKAQQTAQEAEQSWNQQRGAEQNLTNLVTRYAQRERRAEDQREQRTQDELGQRPRSQLDSIF